MDNLAIFQKASSVLRSGRPIALVTVVATLGSTPGKVGYKMLVFDEGRGTVGTVGGGLIEATMIQEAAGMLGRSASRSFHFDLGETPEDEKGICGGSVELFLEAFDSTALPLWEELSQATGNDEGGAIVSIVSRDGLPRKMLVKDVDRIDAADAGLSREIVTALKQAAASGKAGVRIHADEMDVFIEPLALQPSLVLFGAGHVSSHIAKLAKSVHFRVTVCDDRAEYANAERFPDAEEICVEDFSRVFQRVRIDEGSYLVIVTRGHLHDEIVLEQAVRTNARYIGMIGSKRKTQMIIEKLRARGIAPELLARVYSPIGIAIGAVTPEEIALSIVCELVKIRRLGDEAHVEHMTLLRRENEP